MKRFTASGASRRITRRVCTALLLACLSPNLLAQNGAANGAAAARDTRHDTRFDTLRPDNAFRDWLKAYQSPDSLVSGAGFYTQGAGRERADGQQEMVAGYYRPLSDSLSSLVETSYLPNAQGLSEWSVLGQMGAMLGDGWGMHAGMRHSELGFWGMEGRRLAAQLGLVTLERVWSTYRSQYTVYTSRRDDGIAGGGHRLSLDYLYGSGNSVGLSYGQAWASETVLGAPLASAGTGTNLGVTGEHWIGRGWAVNYDALFQQGADQRGLSPDIRVGLRLQF